jgi:hypothetical protein
MQSSGAAQRRLGDVDGEHLRSRFSGGGPEVTFAAAEVEQSLTGIEGADQEAATQLEAGRPKSFGDRAPEGFVVVA